MFGSPSGVAYPQKVWRGNDLVLIDAHGCVVGEQRWCNNKRKCVGLKDSCLIYQPEPLAVQDMPQEIENFNIERAQVNMRSNTTMAQRTAPLKNSAGNPFYRAEGAGQLARIEPNQQEVPRVNMHTGDASPQFIRRVTNDAEYDKILGVGSLAKTSPPSDTHREVMQNPMYAPIVIDRKTSDAEYTQVHGVGQFAGINATQPGRVITNVIRGGVFTPGQGNVASVQVQSVRKVLSPATQPAYISPLITKNTTVPVLAPSEPVNNGYFYAPSSE